MKHVTVVIVLGGMLACARSDAKPKSKSHAADGADPDDAQAAAFEPGDALERVPTRAGVDEPVIVRAPPATTPPSAVVILYPGGGGRLGLTSAGLASGADNFTVRTRGAFAAAGMVAVVVDAPSDHRESLSAFRASAESAADSAKLVAWASARWHVPVWLVGTSRGTISVGNAAARGVDVAGIVLTSSVTAGKTEKVTLHDTPLGAFTGAVLFVHHHDDACPASPLAGVADLQTSAVKARATGTTIITGGDAIAGAASCSPHAHHGFWGQDAEVVGDIVKLVHDNAPR